MATTYAYYIVAYPHPLVSPPARIERLKLDSETDGETLLKLSTQEYLPGTLR